MDLRKIKKLIDLLEESNLAEIEIKEGEESVRLSRPGGRLCRPGRRAAPAAPAPQAMPMQSPTEASTGGSGRPGTAGRPRVLSPMVGTFYASSARTSRPSSPWASRSRKAKPWPSSKR